MATLCWNWIKIFLLVCFTWEFSYALKTFYIDEVCRGTLTRSSSIKVGSTLSGSNSSGIMKAGKHGSYQPNFKCIVNLNPPYGHGIFIAITKVDVSPNCQDKLTLVNNIGIAEVFCSNFKDNDRSRTFLSLGHVSISFSASSRTTYREGFELTFTAYNVGDCLSRDEYRCDNFFCISKELKCDGYNHCSDRSDQAYCLWSAGAIIGVSVGSFSLLMIIIAVVLYIRKKRSRISANAIYPPMQQIYSTGCPPPPPGYYPLPPPPYTSSPGEGERSFGAHT